MEIHNPCGRGHHKRRKKGARSRFDRRKNDERRNQHTNKENLATSITTQGDSTLGLPVHWQKVASTENIQYCKVESGGYADVCRVTRSVTLNPDHTWSVFIGGKKVPETCSILTRFSSSVTSDIVLSKLIKGIDEAVCCPGNPEEKFVTVCQMRGGSIKGTRGAGDRVAFIDSSPVVDSSGKCYNITVRRVDCEVICERAGQYPLRCTSCQAFRSTLRSSVSRLKTDSHDHTPRTSASSHTSYRNLTPVEKEERMRNLRLSLKLANQKVKRLETKVSSLIESQAIPLQECDNTDVSSLVTDMSPLIEQQFPPDSPQRIFWDQQKKYNSLKDNRQMRWHPLMIRFALNLKYLSTSAYRAMRQSGMISLPSERTLSDYTHWTTPHSGVQLEFIEQLHSLLEEEVACGQHHCTLSMDEMKLKGGLVFNKHTGNLCGFVDLGNANRDIELAVNGPTEESPTAKLAEQAFVFLARAAFKPSLSVPIAHYFSAHLKGTVSLVYT